jgi:uncharacterized protein (TIGR02246 family)
MKTYLTIVAACLALQVAAPAVQAKEAPVVAAKSSAVAKSQQAQIEQLLNKYEQALNASDVEAVVKLYTDDGVFMAPENPAAVGTETVRKAYTGVFQAISIKLKFDIVETKLLSADWALLRTTSTGTVKILANGAEVPGSNQELFVLHKTKGQWKIARYAFNSVLRSAK